MQGFDKLFSFDLSRFKQHLSGLYRIGTQQFGVVACNPRKDVLQIPRGLNHQFHFPLESIQVGSELNVDPLQHPLCLLPVTGGETESQRQHPAAAGLFQEPGIDLLILQQVGL